MNAMTRKTRGFLVLASLSMLVVLLMIFIPSLYNEGVRGFCIGFAAAMMVGVAITWNKGRTSQN